MKTLLIDNYDSFSYNLYQYLAGLNGTPPLVVRNDEASWEALRELEFDNIVISPGPGHPEVERDFGVCRRAILESPVPLLGVCLGHQGICTAFGGEVREAARPVHGRASAVHHHGGELFRGLPSPFPAVRYHSLQVTVLPEVLERLAWTDDGVLMALRHRERPIWGVQFHPESIGTPHGRLLLQNFRDLTAAHARPKRLSRAAPRGQDGSPPTGRIGTAASEPGPTTSAEPGWEVHHRHVPVTVDAATVFTGLFGDASASFWLDGEFRSGEPRFSYMGDATGPNAECLRYDVTRRTVEVLREGVASRCHETAFDHLARMLRLRRPAGTALPFPFHGGYVGYLGYELKADCGASNAHRAPTPDAAFIFADRFLAFDHASGDVHLVCLERAGRAARAAQWLRETTARLLAMAPPPDRPAAPRVVACTPPCTPRHDRTRYLELIAVCQDEIRRGQSYEVCLTNLFECAARVEPLPTWLALRRHNPAPHGAYFAMPGIAVLGSSPERFLRVDADGAVCAQPIKGTRRRSAEPREDAALRADLAGSAKDRAENLMIVDLLRNDLGRVCEIGSVEVPQLFVVESYATVHQLVSTITGRLAAGCDAVQAARAAFPPGSMTGAPKLRTMEIIDRLEGGARRPYSGALGWFGVDGAADLGVVIRSIVVAAGGASVGAGGAIVDLSEPRAELDEMLLKAAATEPALREAVAGA